MSTPTEKEKCFSLLGNLFIVEKYKELNPKIIDILIIKVIYEKVEKGILEIFCSLWKQIVFTPPLAWRF